MIKDAEGQWNIETIAKELNNAGNDGNYRFTVCKLNWITGRYVALYELIPRLSDAYLLTQYEMDKDSADEELIFIFPGYNNTDIKKNPLFENYVDMLCKEYKYEIMK